MHFPDATPNLKPKYENGSKVSYRSKEGVEYTGTIIKSEMKTLGTGFIYMVKLDDDYLENKNIIVRETRISPIRKNKKSK